MTAYTIAARANAALLANEAGLPARSNALRIATDPCAPVRFKLADIVLERLGWGAGSAGSAADFHRIDSLPVNDIHASFFVLRRHNG